MRASIRRIALATIALVALIVIAVRQPTFAFGARSSAARADAGALRSDVAFLTTSIRDAEHPAELDAVAAYLEQRFARATPRVRSQRFVVRGRAYRNVIASFGPQTNAPLVIVGAHYDVYSPRARHFPGADDNASGAAALLELARLLAFDPPNVPVELVAYANEEPPFFGSGEMGSAIHAESLRGRGVRAMLCLEMVGCFHGTQASPSWLLNALYPRRANFVAVCGGWNDIPLTRAVKSAMQPACALPVVSFSGPRSLTDASDQRSYWARGWTAVMITDTAYLRNPRYHTARDTADTLDY